MEKKTIVSGRLDFKGMDAFWTEVDEAYKDGWRYEGSCLSVKEAPRGNGLMRITLIKGEILDLNTREVESDEKSVIIPEIEDKKEVVEIKDSPEPVEGLEFSTEELENLSKKDELLEYAKMYGLEIHDDLKQPKAIKKYILEQLSN